MLYHSEPSSLVFFAEWLKIIMDIDLQIIEVQLKPKLHQLWRISLWLGKLQLWVFLKKVWVFYLKSVVHALVINKLNSLWTVLLLPLCEQIACFVPTVKPMLIRPVNSHCSDQQELASGSDAQQVLWNGTPKCLSTGIFPLPSSPFDQRPVHRLEVNQLAILQSWPRIWTQDYQEKIQLVVRAVGKPFANLLGRTLGSLPRITNTPYSYELLLLTNMLVDYL